MSKARSTGNYPDAYRRIESKIAVGQCAVAFSVDGDVDEKQDIDIHALRPNRFIDSEIFTSTWGGGNRA